MVDRVGCRHRHVGAFQGMRRLVEAGDRRGRPFLAETCGPVVLKPKGSTRRINRVEGGGCLHAYAAHPINLVNRCFGPPAEVSGTVLNSIFSADADEVCSTLNYPGGLSAHLSVSRGDESRREMSAKITLTGTEARVMADRQELQACRREPTSRRPTAMGAGT